MNDKFTIRQFQQRFPTDEACLEEIKLLKYGSELECPKCHRTNKFYKIKGRMSYSCAFCRHQVYPLVGTIFYKSTTPLRDWMYAIYLMSQTRAGISAKQLERELGCTYKTAWRMFHLIRSLMAEDDKLSGEVEVDEVYMHPDYRMRSSVRKPERRNRSEDPVIFGMVERKGKVVAKHVKDASTGQLFPQIAKTVKPRTIIYSDEYLSYKGLGRRGYHHLTIRHANRQYVDGYIHTQNIENFWSNMKRGIRGVYRHVDPKYLQNYVDEYAFRYSNRDNPRMFDAILDKITYQYSRAEPKQQ